MQNSMHDLIWDGQFPFFKSRKGLLSMFSLFQQHPALCTHSFLCNPSPLNLAQSSSPWALGPWAAPWKSYGGGKDRWMISDQVIKWYRIDKRASFIFISSLQLELQSCCVFLPNDSLPSPSTIICGDIPGTVRSWYHNQASMPGTLVVCLPQISVLSAGHKYMEPLQELPFVVSKPILEEGRFSYCIRWNLNLN